MRITWLADELRAAGLTVIEHAGWRERAVDGTWAPQFGIVHATAAPASQSDATQVRIVRDGREGLQGPIAVACVDRDARWQVVAAGRCNTTIAGTAGPYEGKGNTYALGVEACNNNIDEPWPPAQYRSYVAGWAVIAKRMGWSPAQLRGHKEHTPGHKTDPTFNMDTFRADVARAMTGEDDMATVNQQDWDALMWRVAGLTDGSQTVQGGPTRGERIIPIQKLIVVERDLAALKARVEAIAGEDAARDTQAQATLTQLQTLLQQHADGTTDADAIVRRMGELLNPPSN